MQLRLHASKTIARPQFRELAPQIYQDFESDREFTGNPFLTDSELLNARGALRILFRAAASGCRVAGFYKKIDNPIEAAAFFAGGGQLRTGFANAPQAELYGAEVEVAGAICRWRASAAASSPPAGCCSSAITPTPSRGSAPDDSVIIGPDLQPVAANLLFEDGAPLTGQSDHLANLQIGIEDTDSVCAGDLPGHLCQRAGHQPRPDPGPAAPARHHRAARPAPRFRARQEVPLFGARVELKLEARNLLGQDYEEFQQAGGNRIDINSYPASARASASA